MVIYISMSDRKKNNSKTIKFIDLFCGIGGFRLAIEQEAMAREG
jgi:tRNA/tmRNA/rRNA uracil-C5-methylase (TrmA/RlmC/RlmD family)